MIKPEGECIARKNKYVAPEALPTMPEEARKELQTKSCTTIIVYCESELFSCFTKHCRGIPRPHDPIGTSFHVLIKRTKGKVSNYPQGQFSQFESVFQNAMTAAIMRPPIVNKQGETTRPSRVTAFIPEHIVERWTVVDTEKGKPTGNYYKTAAADTIDVPIYTNKDLAKPIVELERWLALNIPCRGKELETTIKEVVAAVRELNAPNAKTLVKEIWVLPHTGIVGR